MIKVKVCGMRESENIRQLVELNPHYIGFVFYEKSPRFAGEDLDQELLLSIPRHIKKVGVFVNSNFDYILKTVRKYGLDWAQLHGNETPEFCRNLRLKGVGIIKAFAIGPDFNFRQLYNFKQHCDFFLFDTQGVRPGGNGKTFDWQLLNQYDNEKPFFLSGGIDLPHLEQLPELSELNLHAIDVNSRFEISPGLKDISKVRTLMERMSEMKLTTEK
jgi:phosphoribosylanthranilate isomerase